MKNTYLCLIILISVISLSCGSDNTTNTVTTPIDSTAFKYPLTNGNSWNYSRTMSVSNIRPDSIRHYFSGYPVTGSGTVTVLYDTMVNSVNVKCLGETYISGTAVSSGRYYYLNTDSAMYVYGYRGAGIFLPYKKQGEIFLKIDGKLIRPEELSALFQYERNSDSPDSVITEIPPKQSLLYPEQSGRRWVMKMFGTDSLIKQYINFENLIVNNSNISCVKVHKWWAHLTNFNMYEYQSKYGQMKLEIIGKDLLVSNEFGVDIGYIDTDELSTVTSYNVIVPIPLVK